MLDVLLASVDRASVPLARRTEGLQQHTPWWAAVEESAVPFMLPSHCVQKPLCQQQLHCWEVLVQLSVGWIGIDFYLR